MTIKEFYEWAKEKGIEDYKMVNAYWDGEGDYTPDEWDIDEKEKKVYTVFEC